MTGPAIEAIELGKVYPGGVRALAEVAVRAGYGEVFAYLGRNGSGKTTTIRILTTLTAATTGTARVAGPDVGRDPRGGGPGNGGANARGGPGRDDARPRAAGPPGRVVGAAARPRSGRRGGGPPGAGRRP